MQFLLCLLVAALAEASEVENAHPIKNVMAMIQQLDQKAKKLGKDEAVSFEEYGAFMEKEKKTFSKKIDGLKENIQEAETELKALTAEKDTLQEKRETSLNRFAKQTAAITDARAQRTEAKALFSANLQDINSTIQALTDGLSSLEAVKQKPASTGGKDASLLRAERTVAKTLVQQHASLLEVASKDDEAILLNLAAISDLDLASEAETVDSSVPTQAPVKSHTGSVVDLLKKLLLSYEDKLKKTTMEALQAQGDFDLAQAQRTESLSLVQSSKQTQESSLAEVNSKISTVSSELAAAEKDLKANSKSLQDTETELKMRLDEYKERTYMRKKEHEAFQYGLQILAKVSGLQAPTSLVQIPSSPKMQVVEKKIRAINLLHEAAHIAQSSELHRLASELEDGAAPVAQVGKQVDLTIQQQVWKIKDDQLDDDKKKAWCEQEVNKTKIEKKFKGDELQEFRDKIEVEQAGIATLEDGLETAAKELAESKKDIHEETMLREKAKNENRITAEDAKDSQAALKVALENIKKYYDDAAVPSASFIQARKGAPSPGWTQAGYTGVAEGSSGTPGKTILTLLESTMASYGTMEATAKAEETQQQAEHENKMKDMKIIIAESETEIELKTQERFRLVEKLKGFTESAKLTDRQATSLETYLTDVTTDCYGSNSTFATRAAERRAELASLNASRETLLDAFNVTAGTQLLRNPVAPRSARVGTKVGFLAPR